MEQRLSLEKVQSMGIVHDEHWVDLEDRRQVTISDTGEPSRTSIVNGPQSPERAGMILRHADITLEYLELRVRLLDMSPYVIPANDLAGICNLRHLRIGLGIRRGYFKSTQNPTDPWLLSLIKNLPSQDTLEKLKLHYKISLEKGGDELEALEILQLFMAQRLDNVLSQDGDFAELRHIRLRIEMSREGRPSSMAQERNADGFFPSTAEHRLSR